ncbi:hypothetical protein ACQCWI_28315 [Bacillus thuringiensis]|uniref:hypothetical protein n=1 Tax=Bacillus thuringiensis TaxID=1428 RepID=UPI003CF71BCF
MSKNIDGIDTKDYKSKRKNPLLDNENEPATGGKQNESNKEKYATIRIYPDDHKLLKDLAYHEERKMVEIVNDSVNYYNEFYELAKKLGISTDGAIKMALEQLKNK